jgi:hypothetical protein
MKIPPTVRTDRGSMMIELSVAMAILLIALIPLAYSILDEFRLARTYYQRAAAMELIDGEMEVLVAGRWRETAEGEQAFHLSGHAAENLGEGAATLHRSGKHLKLTWTPAKRHRGGAVVREAEAR